MAKTKETVFVGAKNVARGRGRPKESASNDDSSTSSSARRLKEKRREKAYERIRRDPPKFKRNKAGEKIPLNNVDKQKFHLRQACRMFSKYIFRVLKQVHPDIGISVKAMMIVHDMCLDVFYRIAREASFLARRGKTSIIRSRDIQTAVRLLFPGELAKHAVSEGTKAVAKLEGSRV